MAALRTWYVDIFRIHVDRWRPLAVGLTETEHCMHIQLMVAYNFDHLTIFHLDYFGCQIEKTDFSKKKVKIESLHAKCYSSLSFRRSFPSNVIDNGPHRTSS